MNPDDLIALALQARFQGVNLIVKLDDDSWAIGRVGDFLRGAVTIGDQIVNYDTVVDASVSEVGGDEAAPAIDEDLQVVEKHFRDLSQMSVAEQMLHRYAQ